MMFLFCWLMPKSQNIRAIFYWSESITINRVRHIHAALNNVAEIRCLSYVYSFLCQTVFNSRLVCADVEKHDTGW